MTLYSTLLIMIMLQENTHIALAVTKLEGNGKFGSRFRIRCLPSDMKRFVSWDNAVSNYLNIQGIAWLQANNLTVTGKSWDEAKKTSILLVDWNKENLDFLADLRLW